MSGIGGTARDVAALLGGLVVGVVAVVGISQVRSDASTPGIVYEPDERVVEIAAPVQSEPGASTPEAAIEGFLDAVVGGDAEHALSLLAPSDRALFPTVRSLQRSLQARIGEVAGFDPITVEPGPSSDQRLATTTLSLRPSLDLVNGLTPPAARTEWVLVESDGWRVALGDSEIDRLYDAAVDETTVVDTATLWLSERHWCPGAPSPDASGSSGTTPAFRGSKPRLLDAFCASEPGAERLGDPVELDAATAADGLAASFGSSVREWARVVPVSGPIEARLVLAPLGDRWVVIDVVAP